MDIEVLEDEVEGQETPSRRVHVTDGDRELFFTEEAWRDLHKDRDDDEIQEFLDTQLDASVREPEPLPGV